MTAVCVLLIWFREPALKRISQQPEGVSSKYSEFKSLGCFSVVQFSRLLINARKMSFSCRNPHAARLLLLRVESRCLNRFSEFGSRSVPRPGGTHIHHDKKKKKKTWKITRIILQRLSAKFLSGVGGETPDGRKEQVAEEDM